MPTRRPTAKRDSSKADALVQSAVDDSPIESQVKVRKIGKSRDPRFKKGMFYLQADVSKHLARLALEDDERDMSDILNDILCECFEIERVL